MKRTILVLVGIVALLALSQRTAQAQYQNCWTQSYSEIVSIGGGSRGTQFCIQTTTETMCYVSDFIEVVDSSYTIACYDASAKPTREQRQGQELLDRWRPLKGVRSILDLSG